MIKIIIQIFMIYKITLNISLIFIFINFQGQEYNNSIEKSYPKDSINSLEIINKYGDIILTKWNKDSLKIKAILIIQSNNESRINKIKDDISFIFENKKEKVLSIRTNIGSSAGLLENLFNAQNKFKLDYNVKIHYYVYIPLFYELENLYLETKYGDISLGNTRTKLAIKLSHGSLICKNIENEAELNIFSSNICIENINELQINTLYSDVNIKKAKKLEIESRVSSYNLDNSDNLKIKSHNDNFKINHVNKIDGNFYFTDVAINNLTKELNCLLNYGKLIINRLNKTVSFIYIDSEFSDIDLILPRNHQGIIMDIKYSKTSSINYPSDFCKLDYKILNPENEIYLLYGKCGNNPQTKININLRNKTNLNMTIKNP